MVYVPLIQNLFNFKDFSPRSAGYSIAANRKNFRHGICGLTGAHESGHWKVTPYIGGTISRDKNVFKISEFINQRALAGSDAFLWESGQASPEAKRLADWTTVGLKPMYESILADVKELLPAIDNNKFPGMRAFVLYSEEDLRHYASTKLLKDSMLSAFMTFPNVTGQTLDTYYIPTFMQDKRINNVFPVDGLSTYNSINGALGTGGLAATIKFNAQCVIDVMPVPNLERTIAPLRQNKSMWNHIEDLFGIRKQFAPIDFLYLANQFQGTTDFSQFVFDQIFSFDQRPFMNGLDVQQYVASQLLRLMAFKYIITKVPLDQWITTTNAVVRHPGLTDADFEIMMTPYDKMWAAGSLERVSSVGEGLQDLFILPFGSRNQATDGFGMLPAVSFTEVAPVTENVDPVSYDLTRTPRVVTTPSNVSPKIISWDRIFGVDGLTDDQYCAIGLNVITPTLVKRIIPLIRNSNPDFLQRIGPEYHPILIQLRDDPDSNITDLNYKSASAKYAQGLVSFFKGPAFAFNPEDLETDSKEITAIYREKDESGKWIDRVTKTTRLSMFPLIQEVADNEEA